MKPKINFQDWQKLDLRVGQIIEVEEIEGADKLYKLTIDLGEEIGKRTVCAGIKEYYDKEDLNGRKVVLLVNLQPKALRGIESQGMILCVDEDGKPTLLSPEKDVGVGSLIR